MKTLSDALHRKLSGTLHNDKYWGELILTKKNKCTIIAKPYICYKCANEVTDQHHTFDCNGTNYNSSVISYHLTL